MKGIVFTEFFEMVEAGFGYEMVDQLIIESNLPSDGVYTSIGTYSHSELIQMVVLLAKKTNTPVPELVKAFGRHLFGVFYKAYPIFFERCDHVFDFLESIDNHIHVEVRKLYPDAELPTFGTKRIGSNIIQMTYSSARNLPELAEGLIEETMKYYQQDFKITTNRDDDTPNLVHFSIELK